MSNTKDKPKRFLNLFSKSVLIPIAVAVATTLVTGHINRGCEEDRSREKARSYADRLEAKYNLEIKRKKEDSEKHCKQLQQAKKDSINTNLKHHAGEGRGRSGAADKDKKSISQYFDKLIEDEKTMIERYEIDAKMQVEAIRETGVILKLE